MKLCCHNVLQDGHTGVSVTPEALGRAYEILGKGGCRDEAGKSPRSYFKHNTVPCRAFCATLSAACVGYSWRWGKTRYDIVPDCRFYGSALPDQGTGAPDLEGNDLPENEARQALVDNFSFDAGTGGSDTLTHGDGVVGDGSGESDYECRARLPFIYKFLGRGGCTDRMNRYPKSYKTPASLYFSSVSGCQDLCTTLSDACLGYSYGVGTQDLGPYPTLGCFYVGVACLLSRVNSPIHTSCIVTDT